MNGRPRRKTSIDKIIDDAMDYINDAADEIEKSISSYTSAPETDLIETYDNIIVHTNLPGVKKEDITIDLTDEKLKIKVLGYEATPMEEGAQVRAKGRKHGRIKRVIKLPEKVIVEETVAKLENGVLTVTMPKAEKKVRHEVPIQ
ncbi:Hsp20/alpha crystallin family protein [Methanobacterium sp.]|uniref:Hsp20/alpha crystallin family protein n=1 Tax=Methanobacterium sp. TaxID=2164 RepID=UPI003C707190